MKPCSSVARHSCCHWRSPHGRRSRRHRQWPQTATPSPLYVPRGAGGARTWARGRDRRERRWHPDLIVANIDDKTVSILLGDGRGHFAAAPGSPFACGPGANDIAVADMNRDGHPDLVIANTETPFLTVLLGDGQGRFAPAPGSPFQTTSVPHVHGVAVADFMGDGRPAVVTDSWGHDKMLLLPGSYRAQAAEELAARGRSNPAFLAGRFRPDATGAAPVAHDRPSPL